MNLLLLLSALLSALGGTAGGRTPEAPLTMSSRVADVAQASVAKRMAVASRPGQALPGPVRAVVSVSAPLALDNAIPLYAERRRE